MLEGTSMWWKKEKIFAFYDSYNLMTIIFWVITHRNKCKRCSEKRFPFMLGEADNMESQEVY